MSRLHQGRHGRACHACWHGSSWCWSHRSLRWCRWGSATRRNRRAMIPHPRMPRPSSTRRTQDDDALPEILLRRTRAPGRPNAPSALKRSPRARSTSPHMRGSRPESIGFPADGRSLRSAGPIAYLLKHPPRHPRRHPTQEPACLERVVTPRSSSPIDTSPGSGRACRRGLDRRAVVGSFHQRRTAPDRRESTSRASRSLLLGGETAARPQGRDSVLFEKPKSLASSPGVIVAGPGEGSSSFPRGRYSGRRETCPVRSGR